MPAPHKTAPSRKSVHFLYHELRPVTSPYSYVLECSAFEEHCRLFSGLLRTPGGNLLPEITFDDGHSSNHEYAVPILETFGLKARFFITVGWTGTRSGYMGWNDLRAIHAAGHAIGAHGWSHALLTHCTASELHKELADARARLEDGLGSSIDTMSLPGGRGDSRVLNACWEAGYSEIFTSAPGPVELPVPPRSTVGRLNVRSGMSSADVARILDPETGTLAGMQRSDHLKTVAKRLMGDRLYARLWALLNRQEIEPDTAGERAE